MTPTKLQIFMDMIKRTTMVMLYNGKDTFMFGGYEFRVSIDNHVPTAHKL